MKLSTDVVFVMPPAPRNLAQFGEHLGTAYLRAALAHAGIRSVQYRDSRPGSIAMVSAGILEHNPQIVGFTTYEANLPLCASLARCIKSMRPSVRIIAGGPCATFSADRILARHDAFDLCVRGEAEVVGPEIIGNLLAGVDPTTNPRPGLAYRQGSQIVQQELAPLMRELDDAPSPYLEGLLADGRPGILTGRGCTHLCQYCCYAALGRNQLRFHSIQRVLDEIRIVAEHQKRTRERYCVPVNDDAFTLAPRRAKLLCQAIADLDLGLTFSCETRADTLDDELLRLMRKAGFAEIFFGIESAVPSVLRAIGKVRPPDSLDQDLSPEQAFLEKVRNGVFSARKHGFRVLASVIFGLPGETREDAKRTLRFIRELPLDGYAHHYLAVYPGTPLWETHRQYGITCRINTQGVAETLHAYNTLRLKPQPGSSVEAEAFVTRLLALDAMTGCESFLGRPGAISAAVLRGSRLSAETAAWLSEILAVGSVIVQVHTRENSAPAIRHVRENLEALRSHAVPAQTYVQALPRQVGSGGQAWSLHCQPLQAIRLNRPDLLSITSSRNAEPLIAWLRGLAPSCNSCDIASCLRSPLRAKQLLEHLTSKRVGSTPADSIPPAIAYPGRWLPGPTACLSLTRIEIGPDQRIRACRNSAVIGSVGDTPDRLAARLFDLGIAAQERRGCEACRLPDCPRCPFPGLDDATYCGIMRAHRAGLESLGLVHLRSRLLLLLEHHLSSIDSALQAYRAGHGEKPIAARCSFRSSTIL